MQLVLIIAIGLAALASDAGLHGGLESMQVLSTTWALSLAIAAPVVTTVLLSLLVRKTLRAFDRGGAHAYARAVRLREIAPWIGLGASALLLYGSPFVAQLPEGTTRRWLLPLVCVGIPLFTAIGALAAWYPLEQRFLASTLIRRLDEGSALQPFLSRGAYVAARLRLTVLLTLAPIGIPMCIGALVAECIERVEPGTGQTSMDIATVASAVLLFMLAPLLVRGALGLRVLEQGALRMRLDQIAMDAGAAIRAIYIWPTGGLVANAMVLGVIPGTRAVILTDRLVESLRDDELDAVVAHEIGHIKRRHLLWFIVVIIASFTLGGFIVEPLWWMSVEASQDESLAGMRDVISIGAAFALGLWIFGFASRRFERQADAFAVQLLSTRQGASEATPEAIASVVGALQMVCKASGVAETRHSWRHGSIRSRTDALRSLHGIDLHRFPIDRTANTLKLASIIIALLNVL
ncbi:MAG: hypothetical protein EXS10_01265 [Phycisphaerales bacterium]|nr:hypothetical protein [Phycisphaerales bacterium]